jgi:surface polysaccharide O-acyltransferase-like enzyme
MTRNSNIDILRVTATWLIVIAHVVGNIEGRPDFFGGKAWWIAHSLSTLSNAATPIFFIISGYLLSDKNRPLKETARHTFYRLVIPFIIFTIGGTLIYNLLQFRITWSLIGRYIWIGGGTHLYFLVGLTVLYLLNPFIHKLRDHLTDKQLIMGVGFLLLNTVMLLVSGYALNSLDLISSIFLYWFMALGYFCYGACYKVIVNKLGQRKWFSSWWLILVIILINILLSYLFMKLGREGNNEELKMIAGYWQNYYSVTVMFVGLVTFNWFMKLDLKEKISQKIKNGLEFLAKYSFGVYLCHMIVLEFLLQKTPISPYNSKLPLLLFILFGIFLTLILSHLISWILSNTKYLQIAVGEKRQINH